MYVCCVCAYMYIWYLEAYRRYNVCTCEYIILQLPIRYTNSIIYVSVCSMYNVHVHDIVFIHVYTCTSAHVTLSFTLQAIHDTLPFKAKAMMERLIAVSQDAVFKLESEPVSTVDFVTLLKLA